VIKGNEAEGEKKVEPGIRINAPISKNEIGETSPDRAHHGRKGQVGTPCLCETPEKGKCSQAGLALLIIGNDGKRRALKGKLEKS